MRRGNSIFFLSHQCDSLFFLDDNGDGNDGSDDSDDGGRGGGGADNSNGVDDTLKHPKCE